MAFCKQMERSFFLEENTFCQPLHVLEGKHPPIKVFTSSTGRFFVCKHDPIFQGKSRCWLSILKSRLVWGDRGFPLGAAGRAGGRRPFSDEGGEAPFFSRALDGASALEAKGLGLAMPSHCPASQAMPFRYVIYSFIHGVRSAGGWPPFGAAFAGAFVGVLRRRGQAPTVRALWTSLVAIYGRWRLIGGRPLWACGRPAPPTARRLCNRWDLPWAPREAGSGRWQCQWPCDNITK